jgi:hypothetical protein
LIAERRQKKKLKKEQRERNAQTTDVDSTAMETAEAHDPSMVKKEEDIDAGKEKMAQPKKEEKGDECPICLEILPKDASEFTRWTCCGNGIHNHCGDDMKSMKMIALVHSVVQKHQLQKRRLSNIFVHG